MPYADDVNRLVADCVRYWTESGVPKARVDEMRLELTHHLEEAVQEGRSAASVVGPNLGGFAAEWAAENRPGDHPAPDWNDVISGRTARDRAARREIIAFGFGIVAVVVAVAVAGRGANPMENEIWRWLWTGLAIVMGIGEIFTAGFFLLPFAIGAAFSAVLAWIGAGLLTQWLVFFGVSVAALTYLRRYIDQQDHDDQPRIGANRWVGAAGIVLEAIDPDTGTGMVRVENEEWRATSQYGRILPAGARVSVKAVRGTRLVVEMSEE